MSGWANHSPGDPWGDSNAGRQRETQGAPTGVPPGRADEDSPGPSICPDCRVPMWASVPHTCGEYDGEEWVRADDVREWLKGLRRTIKHDLGDTTAWVRGSNHPDALVQEFDRCLDEDDFRA
jgi:hypothetical protein